MLVRDSPHAEASYGALEDARQEGAVIACPIVWAEVRGVFQNDRDMEVLVKAGIEFAPIDRQVAELADQSWRLYRSKGGNVIAW